MTLIGGFFEEVSGIRGRVPECLVWVRVFLSGDRDNPSSEELIERIINKVEREVR
ncbi:MAG: hypothetical protein AAGB03_10130 [Pseudomonadota bacterium]